MPVELADERLDRIVALVADVSRAKARRLIESGGVSVDGVAIVAAAARVAAGAALSLAAIEPPPPLAPEQVDFTIVWEDAYLAVIDKPAGVVVHPGAGNASGTLAAGLLYHWPEIEGVGDEGRWGIVHRLDKGTSGLLVIGKTIPALEALRERIAQHAVDRLYLALVQHPMLIETGTIDAPIERDPGRPNRRRVHPAGRPARTHYSQLATWPEHVLLQVELETGRTHQIRVHLTSIEHPVVGDRTYRAASDPADPGRVWLHSWKLAFEHPMTGEEVSCESPLPGDLVESLDVLGEPETGATPRHEKPGGF